jgi:hypothetical protein
MVENFGSALPSKLLIFAQERRQLERLQVVTEPASGAARSSALIFCSINAR